MREISICCRNCSQGSCPYFDLPLTLGGKARTLPTVLPSPYPCTLYQNSVNSLFTILTILLLSIRLYEQEFSKRFRKSYFFKESPKILYIQKRVRISYSDNMSESGQLGQIWHSWAVLKKGTLFYMILSFERTSSYFIKKVSSRKLKTKMYLMFTMN